MKANMRYTDLGPIEGYVLNVLDRKRMDIIKVGKYKTLQQAKKGAIRYIMTHKSVKKVYISRFWTHDGFGDENYIERTSGVVERTDHSDRFAWAKDHSWTSILIDVNGNKI